MEKESTGEWKFVDGSDVPASFEYECLYGHRGIPSCISNAEYNFMSVYCSGGRSHLGELSNFPKYSKRFFICQDQ